MVNLRKLVHAQFALMCATGKLFTSTVLGQELWNLYIGSFLAEHNPQFRDPQSSEHNCTLCSNFIRRYGNIVAIDENTIITLWDILPEAEYAPSCASMSALLKSKAIGGAFFEKQELLNELNYGKSDIKGHIRLGVMANHKHYSAVEACLHKHYTMAELAELNQMLAEEIPSGLRENEAAEMEKLKQAGILAWKMGHGTWIVMPDEEREFNHLSLDIPKQFVDENGDSLPKDKDGKPIIPNPTLPQILSWYTANKEVFMRAMEEIATDTYVLMKELIIEEALISSGQYIGILKKYIALSKEYADKKKAAHDNKTYFDSDTWCWNVSYDLKGASRFLGSLQGEFLKDVTEGKELQAACDIYNHNIDSANYGKAKKAFTPAMRAAFIRECVALGLSEDSFKFRHAKLLDISVEEIKHINAGTGDIKEAAAFGNLKAQNVPNKSKHKKSELKASLEVGIEKFMEEILPTCKGGIELFFEYEHRNNLCNLMIAQFPGEQSIFKYTNPFTKTFVGNLAGKSQLTEQVEAAGGRIDGAFRFTHSWNELEPNQSLMDLHVFMPGCVFSDKLQSHFSTNGRRVGWNNRTDTYSKGKQDVDYITAAPPGKVPCENITFPSLSLMPEGTYTCRIHNWSFRQTGGRGKAEIAIGNEVYQYIYPATKQGEWVTIAIVTLKNGIFTIKHHIEPQESESPTKELYGLELNRFHKVNLVCLSPNYWGENNMGIKHYMFMLENCRTNKPLIPFHTEDLKSQLAKHNAAIREFSIAEMVAPDGEQLAGLGFNATVRDSIFVKVGGSHQRVIKVNF